jgi:hypothetical protein
MMTVPPSDDGAAMLIAQYSIPLPTDYDMGIIRKRVSDHGAKMDGFPGLDLKAYLIQEKGVRGAHVNQYAPFYRWADVEGAARFFFRGAGFGGIVRDFGRPVVRSWLEGTCQVRGGVEQAAFATRSTSALSPHTDPTDAATEAAQVELSRRADGALMSLYGIDLENWETVQFALWPGEPDPAVGDVFEVLHVSGPAR